MTRFLSSLRGNCIAIDEAISGYLTRLLRSLWLLAMTISIFNEQCLKLRIIL
ncbi:hypothetical protein RMAECT_1042 [Rickettsia rhipicephali str. Ect]|uniref:Uncharacterized protein n=1 Tax=Rickettsia rhipicephali str. Ect TaxID=1359199 RepID=A0A0F3PEV7_RICRH|nr:hypothetical protein RMAECT_1042 [Rickettsia rhipicephali str. Ect]